MAWWKVVYVKRGGHCPTDTYFEDLPKSTFWMAYKIQRNAVKSIQNEKEIMFRQQLKIIRIIVMK